MRSALCAIAAALLAGFVCAADQPFVIRQSFFIKPAVEPAPKTHPDYEPDIPEGAVKFNGTKYTQSIAVVNDRDSIRVFPIKDTPDKRWHQPGGLLDVKGWKAEKFRYLPAGTKVKEFIANIEVENSIPNGLRKPDGTPDHYRQHNRGLARQYPAGTRFDEVLRNSDTGKVFEHRSRTKQDNGKWQSIVEFKDEEARPAGYTGLKVTCSSCHLEAGTGKYDAGLVPGGDTVFSDPLPWHLWGQQSPDK